ncbi:MAG: endonuclease III [Melioribacteraceae bacterium]|nr:endonuclease III [Melioribacteraceae bacterium]MDD3557969.1 endonuclease III [Melioribacteraceae bacterium]
MTQKEIALKNNKIIKVDKLLKKEFGIPQRAEKLPDPVDLTIGTILSQNTNDNNSYKAFKNLKQSINNWNDLLNLSEKELKYLIKIAGLGKQKAATIKNFVNEIYHKNKKINLDFIKSMSNEESIRELTSFKGIGVKTASCVLLFSLDRDVCPVDTHVHRTVNRIGIVSEKQRDKTYFSLNINFPKRIAHSFHTNLIRLGREICKPQKTLCSICPLIAVCEYESKNLEPAEKKKSNAFMLLDKI